MFEFFNEPLSESEEMAFHKWMDDFVECLKRIGLEDKAALIDTKLGIQYPDEWHKFLGIGYD